MTRFIFTDFALWPKISFRKAYPLGNGYLRYIPVCFGLINNTNYNTCIIPLKERLTSSNGHIVFVPIRILPSPTVFL